MVVSLIFRKGEKMSEFTLVQIDNKYIEDELGFDKSKELLTKKARIFVSYYDDLENWYIPLRANINKRKPKGTYHETPYIENDIHFKNAGLDFQKSLYLPKAKTKQVPSHLPVVQIVSLIDEENIIIDEFEQYVLSLNNYHKNSKYFKWSSIPLFPKGIDKINSKRNEGYRDVG